MADRPKWQLFVFAFQLTLPRAAAGWLFAILTSNFNRIAIFEMGITAVVVTSMLGLYHFLSPFQVICGRIADRAPIFGYHRSPYILAGMMLSAFAVAALPPIAVAMSQHPNELYGITMPYISYITGFIVLIFFGIGFAMAGSNHLALVAEVIPERGRGITTALIWTMMIIGMIGSLQFIRGYMPHYDYETMKSLYWLSIPVVFVLTFFGIVGIEKRASEKTEAEKEISSKKQNDDLPDSATLKDFVIAIFTTPSIRRFFLYIFLFQIGYSLQDNILEVFGADVLQMTVGETGRFQQIWGGGAIVGMFMMGFLVMRSVFSKRVAITIGVLGIATSLFLLSFGAFEARRDIVSISLVMMGFFNGFALVGTLTAMMEFTTDHERGAYIGLWGLAVAFASGMGSILGGQLVTSWIESGLFAASSGFSLIFLIEGCISLSSLWFLWRVVHPCLDKKLHKNSVSQAMEADIA